MDEFKCLISLSRELTSQGCYLQAAKCLEAAVGCHQALPASRAAACLDYAQLLTDHFDNLDLAKKLLLQAERELRSVRGHEGLKCAVFDRLAACHRMGDDLEQAAQAVAAGLAAADAPRWRAYFLARTAELRMEGDADAALETLQEAGAVPGLGAGDAALLSLAAAAVNLRAGRMDATDAALTAAAAHLEEGADTLSEAVASRMRAHYFLLYAATALAVGRASQIAAGGDYPVFTQLQEQLSGAGMDGGGWLPGPAAAALGHAAHGAVLRSAGKGSAAAVQLGQAEELVEAALGHLGVTVGAGEGALAPGVAAAAAPYLRLYLALVEQRALAALVAADFTGAARYAEAAVAAVRLFPRLLRPQTPSAAALVGHYAASLGDRELAVALFDAVAGSPAGHMHRLAALAAALAEADAGDADAAAARLQAAGLAAPLAGDELPTHEKAVAQLVNGMVLRARGDAAGARLLLAKALKAAHALIGSTQLVGQVLNVMAPVQAERNDPAGAQQMFDSAATLLKAAGDLPSLVTALRGVHALHVGQGNAALAAKSEQYLGRKVADLEGRVAAARAAADHARLQASARWLLEEMGKA